MKWRLSIPSWYVPAAGCTTILALMLIFQNNQHPGQAAQSASGLINDLASLPTMSRDVYFLRPLPGRGHLGKYLQEQPSMRVGAEIGVQAGGYSKELLKDWTNCRKFYLIDLWAPSENYKDFAQVSAQAQDNLYKTAQTNLAAWKNITRFIRGRSDQVVHEFADESLDFLYLDARHDYCAVKSDLELWWPKVRQGGILAGHDYVSHQEVAPAQDWTLCEDGRKEPGAVLRAVNEFAEEREIIISVMYREPYANSYMMRKPYVQAARPWF